LPEAISKEMAAAGAAGSVGFVPAISWIEINQKCRPRSTHVMRHTGNSQLLEAKEALSPFAAWFALDPGNRWRRSHFGNSQMRKTGLWRQPVASTAKGEA
jgi:hypothetical protein